jgi:hypothetical protein
MKEIYFQLFKTSEGFNVIDMASKEIVEKGLMRKEPILKLISRFKVIKKSALDYYRFKDN